MTNGVALRKDWSDRVTELSQLSGSWDAGYLAVTPRSADIARGILENLNQTNLRVGIWPTSVGGLQLEWMNSNGQFTVNINRSGMVEVRRSQITASAHPVRESRSSAELDEVLNTLREWSV